MPSGRQKFRSFLRDSDTRASALARQLGVARSLVSQWLSGKRVPGRLNANRLEQATGGAVPATSWDAPAPNRPRRPRTA